MIHHRLIRSSTRSWKELFQEAADLATALGPERLLSISHGSDSSDGTITVWWRDTEPGPQRWMRFWFVRSSTRPWASLLDEAAQRASGLADGQLFGVTHSCDNSDGVVAVWYWVDQDPALADQHRGQVALAARGQGTLALPPSDD